MKTALITLIVIGTLMYSHFHVARSAFDTGIEFGYELGTEECNVPVSWRRE